MNIRLVPGMVQFFVNSLWRFCEYQPYMIYVSHSSVSFVPHRNTAVCSRLLSKVVVMQRLITILRYLPGLRSSDNAPRAVEGVNMTAAISIR